MAHRHIKITREIVQTYNKVSKSDLSLFPLLKNSKLPGETVKNDEYHCPNSEMNNTIHIRFPFPKTIDYKGNVCDLKKLDLNTPTLLRSSVRSYSTKKKPSEKDCKKLTKKCHKVTACPRFLLDNCPPTKGSDCAREYIEPCCTKKMAPYPSYSELCAFRLEEDPSECKQCPWQRCGGVDAIKPQKKDYHTTTAAMNMAMIPSKCPEYVPFLYEKQCDASKEPCKEPPPKCQQREKQKKKEKCPEKKKKCKLEPLASEAWMISGSMEKLDVQRVSSDKFWFGKARIDRFTQELGVPFNLAQKIVYEFKKKDCPKNRRKCPHVDRTINDEFTPNDPCCEEAKKGRQPRKRPKIFVPEPRNY